MPRPVSRVSVSCAVFQSSMLQCTRPGDSSTMRRVLLRGTLRVLLLNLQPKICRTCLSTQITLHGLRRLVKDFAVANGAAQLDVFRVRPHQGTGGARGLAAEEFQRGNVGRVPNLFGKQAAVAGGGVFHHGQQGLRFVAMSGGESVVGAFSGEQRPGAADAGAIEGGAIFVLAVAVAVVAIPARALRQFDCEQGVDGTQRVEDARIVGGAQDRSAPEPEHRG